MTEREETCTWDGERGWLLRRDRFAFTFKPQRDVPSAGDKLRSYDGPIAFMTADGAYLVQASPTFVPHSLPDLDTYRLVFGPGPAIADMDPDLWRDA